MGKKTDQFTAQMNSLMGECISLVTNVETISKAAARMEESLRDCQDVMHDRREFFCPDGAPTNEIWRKIEKDKQYKQASESYGKLLVEFKPLYEKSDKTKTELKTHLAALEKKVGEFDVYVKIKEKKWFVGKKSVPAAKTSIASVRTFIKDCQPLVR
jgi:hypothetical protein